jgi:hypothetical protein
MTSVTNFIFSSAHNEPVEKVTFLKTATSAGSKTGNYFLIHPTLSSPEAALPTSPYIPSSAPSRLFWDGPNLLLYLLYVKIYVYFYFPLHQRPHIFLKRLFKSSQSLLVGQ